MPRSVGAERFGIGSELACGRDSRSSIGGNFTVASITHALRRRCDALKLAVPLQGRDSHRLFAQVETPRFFRLGISLIFTLYSSTTGISYLLSSGFLLSFLKKQAPTLKTLRLSALDHYSIHADMKPVLDLVKRHNIILTASDSNYFSHWPTTAVSRPHHDQTIPLTPAEKEMRSKIMHRKIDEQLRMRKVELERLVREKDLVGLQAFAGLIGKGLKDRMLAMRD